MNKVFESAPYSKRKDDDENGLHPFVKAGLNDFIMRLYPLFVTILQTKAELPSEFVPRFFDISSQTDCYEKIAKFLVAVAAHRLRQGGCVERYLKGIPYLPYFVMRLLKIKKGRILLANSDIESLDFRLAILSEIDFMNAEETQLFELKMRKWAERHC